MKGKYGIFLLATFLVLIGIVYYSFGVMTPKYKTISGLDRRIEKKRQQLNSARILTAELDQVARLIDYNLVSSEQDSLLVNEREHFFKYVSQVMEENGIVLEILEPYAHNVRRGRIETTYRLTYMANYETNCKLLLALENYERIVLVDRIDVQDNLDLLLDEEVQRNKDLRQINLHLTTIALVKES